MKSNAGDPPLSSNGECLVHQSTTDAFSSPFDQNRYPPNSVVREQACRPDGTPVLVESQEMNGLLVILVDLDFGGNLLFFHENAISNPEKRNGVRVPVDFFNGE